MNSTLQSFYTFTHTGGAIIVSNWHALVGDKLSPEPVRDLTLLTAVSGSDVFTIGWTAPGDNPGQGTGETLIGHSLPFYLLCNKL